MPQAARTRSATQLLPGRALGIVGVIGIIAATFSPWVTSGTVDRNIYQISGVAAHAGLLTQNSTVMLAVALIGPICLVPILLAALQLRRTAAGTAMIIAVAAGILAGTTLVKTAGVSAIGVHVAHTGPIMMLVAAIILAVGAALTA